MASLTDDELRAVAYYAIGVGSEGSDLAYRLSIAGNVVQAPDGHVVLHPVAASGYSIGTLQTDLGQRPDAVRRLVDSFQSWANANHRDWTLTDQKYAQTVNDLGRNGHQINREHGRDLDQTIKSHLNEYLVSQDGISFVHGKDVAQVSELMRKVAPDIKEADFYKKASPEEQARIFASVAKAYNQSPGWGSSIISDVADHKINSLEDISKKIDAFPDGKDHYMRSGRDAALKGAELFNTLRNTSERNPIHEPWQAVVANPLVNPTQVGNDPKQPHLADQYATVKGVFVEPTEGKKFVDALERSGSHNYGDPARSHSRGFYVEGNDFVQWDKNGHGRAFVGGQWSDVNRSDLSLTHNKDHTLDINLTRNGETHSLLHVTHPTHGHGHAAHHGHEAATLRQGMHGEQAYAPGLDDPRNALNPNHALYNQLKTRIPDASENRLLQFTAACHANKITAENLGHIHLDEANMRLGFFGTTLLSVPVIVDLKTPPPQPAQSIQHIQQYDQQQAQIQTQIQAQNAQVSQQQQGPVLGGP